MLYFCFLIFVSTCKRFISALHIAQNISSTSLKLTGKGSVNETVFKQHNGISGSLGQSPAVLLDQRVSFTLHCYELSVDYLAESSLVLFLKLCHKLCKNTFSFV